MDKRRLLLIVVFSFATAYLLHVASRQVRPSTKIDAKVTAPASAVSSASRSLRPNYPFSVVPGGTYSPAELGSAMAHDALINNHYSDFNLKSARLVALTEDRFQYVSYRMNNRIYWTRNMLRIPKGEVLLTDGSSFARTRCGNRLSSQPRSGIAAKQPAERLLSLPPFTPALLSKGEVTLAAAPVVEGTAPAAPELPFELPRLAPYLPTSAGPIAQQIWPSVQSPVGPGFISAGPPAFSAPGAPGYLPASPGSPKGSVPVPSSPPVTTTIIPIPTDTPGPPGITPVRVPVLPILPGTPGTPVPPPVFPPILPVVPIPPGTPVPPITTVPEPANLTLLAASFCGWLWLLTRVLRLNNGADS